MPVVPKGPILASEQQWSNGEAQVLGFRESKQLTVGGAPAPGP